MLHGLSITWFGPLFGPHFSQFVADQEWGCWIDTFSRACSFPGSFRACCRTHSGPQGVNDAHGLGITSFRRFLGRIFSQFVRTRMGVLGIDTFSRACSFPGSFLPCVALQGVNYALWPWYHLFGPLLGRIFSQFVRTRMEMLGIDTFSRVCSFPGSFWPCAGPQGVIMLHGLVSRVWTAFWAAFFHNLCGQFLALCGPAGCELCSWPQYHILDRFLGAIFS